MAARVAGFFVAAERCGAAGRNVLDCPPLFATQCRIGPLQKRGPDGAEYVANLGARTVYGALIGARASRGLASDVTRSRETAV